VCGDGRGRCGEKELGKGSVMRAGGDMVYGDSATVIYGLCIDDVDVFRAMI
jgi:hypothetical protein